MNKSELLHTLQVEIRPHDFDTFVDNPPSVAQGGRGVVVPDCTICRKRFHTSSQFLDHIADDVIPTFLDKLAAQTRFSDRPY